MSETVQVRIQAIQTGFSQARAAFGQLETSVGKLKSAVFNLRTAFAAAGIGIVLRKLTSESTKFEDALLDLQKVMSDSDGDAKQFTGTVKALSDRFGISAADVLQGAANFKQAGFEIKESFELQKIALETATVSELNAVEASELLISSLKGFKAPASEAGRLTDILNEVSNKYATNMKELAIGMADFSPIAAKANLSFEETAGILTPVIEVFRSGSEAAVALKTGLLRLVSDEKTVRDGLQQLGVAQRDANGAMKSGRDILLEVARAFQTVEETEKLRIASGLVGIRQAARMIEVFDQLAKVSEVTNVALDSHGSRLREVNIRLAAASTVLASTRESFNNLAKTLGDVLMPTILNAAGRLKEFFKAMQEPEAIENFKRILAGAKEIIGDITEIVKGLWGLLIAFPASVIDFFKNVSAEVDNTTNSVAGLNKELQGTKPPDKNRWQLLFDLWKLSLAAVKQNLLDLLITSKFAFETMGNLFGLLVNGLVEGIDILATEFNLLGKFIFQVFTGNFAGAKETFGQFVNDASGFGKKMASDWNVATGNMKEDWKDMVTELHKFIPAAPGPAPARLVGPPQPPGRFDPNAAFVGPQLPEKTKEQGEKTVEAWRKSLGEFNIVTDEEMKKSAVTALENFKKIEASGEITGPRLAEVWKKYKGEVEPGLDLLDKSWQKYFDDIERRFPDLVVTAESSMSDLERHTRSALESMRGPFTDFFDAGQQGFLNLQSLAGNVVNVIRRKLAELAADKAIKFLISAFTGGMGGAVAGGGGKKGILGLGGVMGIFHDGGVVGSGKQPTRQLAFAGIPRMHSGGLAGDEVPAILQKNEGVLSTKGMENLAKLNLGNAGGGGGLTVLAPVTFNISAIDTQSGVAFASRPENLEVVGGYIRQVIIGNGRKSLGL